MTYWWQSDNYGQVLQCFALQKYLRDAGHDAYLIRYDMNNDYPNALPLPPKPIWKRALNIFNPIKLFKYINYYIRSKKQSAVVAEEKRKNEKRKFSDFRSKYINQSEKIYNTYDELKESPPEADIYIVGSDQVWNPDCFPSVERQTKAYFLDFGDSSVKRFSYAASFGKEKINDDYAKAITPLLQKFDYVSVREKAGLDICRQCGVSNAEWVPDPTILLNANIYRELYKNESVKKPNKPYILFYFLGNGSDFSIESVYDWAKSRNLEVVYISANWQYDKYKKTYATIPEWIYLLEHAEYVITNSFHCCVFSMMFEKRFGVIPILQKQVGMNNRMDSLFELFEIEKRWLDSNFSVLDKEIDWQNISKTFQNLQNSCKLVNVIKKEKQK